MNSHDATTTIAGGAAGLLLLQTVRWESIPFALGEPAKILIAIGLIVLGYCMYRGTPSSTQK